MVIGNRVIGTAPPTPSRQAVMESLDHSDHEPAYSFAPLIPACSSASRLWHAVTPEPQ